jgi:hypothetical protein
MKKGERRAFARSTVRAFLIAGLIFVWLELFLACVILPFMLVYEETESEGLALLVAAVTFFIFCGSILWASPSLPLAGSSTFAHVC